MLTIPGNPGDVVISCNYYDAAGSPVVDLFDNPALGWLCDENGAAVSPVMVGALPPKATGDREPQWAHQVDDDVYVPDVWRGSVVDFFTWLAGGGRKVRGNFRSSRLKGAMDVWSANNPTKFNSEPF